MKHTISLFLFLLTFSLASCKKENAVSKVNKQNLVNAKDRDAQIEKGAASISFDKTTHDFGTVEEGSIVKTVFTISNSGKTDLIITEAKASCGCTVPVWPKEPIKSGDSAELKVEFNTSGKPNRQSKTITLFTNTKTGREIVKLTGFVTPKAKS